MKKRTLNTEHVEKILLSSKPEGRKTDDLFSIGSKIFKSYAAEIVTKLKDFKDSPHYFERHKPRFVLLIKDLLSGKLSQVDFPQFDPMGYNKASKSQKHRNIVVFVVGGVSYGEIRELDSLSKETGHNITVGSNFVLNSKM